MLTFRRIQPRYRPRYKSGADDLKRISGVLA
jgi:hypothetical protein